ncbi:hypothetical protein AAG906_000756 [Vitis piasezkii]
MEFQFPFSTIAMAAMFTFLLFLYYLLKISKSSELKRTAPEAVGTWPVIGHLHLLQGSKLPHVTLGAMADEYRPIFTIKLGVQRTLVVSNWKMAKDCFTTNDKVFANRPKSIAVELMGYNYAMFGVGPYGSVLAPSAQDSHTRVSLKPPLEMLKHVPISELKASMKELYELWVNHKSDSNMVMVEMKRWFGDLSLSTIVRMLVGKRFSSDKEDGFRFQKPDREFFELVGMFVLEEWLQNHKRKRISGEAKGSQDFMDVMLSILENAAQDFPGFDADTINKATCLTTDTITIGLVWALSLLLNNSHALKKFQQELDLHVGKERQVDESGMKKLVYLNAVVKETLCLYPVVPLSAPHESVEQCTVGGYHVRMARRLMTNIWKIHRDPRPERFLTSHKDGDVRGQHFEFIPFGSGRRIPLQVMELALSSLIHGFDLSTISNDPVDMSESIGLTNLKATPLEVLLHPRLSSHLYGWREASPYSGDFLGS